jgi:hypothetical protein
MAKLEYRFRGDFQALLRAIDDGIMSGVSSSYEDGSNWSMGDVRCAVRVYERYSVFGANRVSLNVTVVADGNDLFVSAITSGGSQAVLFKVNTIGESTFLGVLDDIIRDFRRED